MPASRSTKVARLLAEGRVEPHHSDGLAMFTVVGDSGTPYRVVVGPTLSGMCQCEHWRRTMTPCAHIEAVREMLGASADVVWAWLEATARRKAADAARGAALIDGLAG